MLVLKSISIHIAIFEKKFCPSFFENVTFIEIENSKHEILNQDTRPFVLSEIFSWLQQNNLV